MRRVMARFAGIRAARRLPSPADWSVAPLVCAPPRREPVMAFFGSAPATTWHGGQVGDFLFTPGAGCDAGYWHLVIERLAQHGHRGIPVQLPCDDDAAGLEEYAQCIVEAARGLSAR
jgi:hypothetical protein